MAFWAVRNCDTVDHREKYAKKLQEYIDVDIYSSVRIKLTFFKKQNINSITCQFCLASI